MNCIEYMTQNLIADGITGKVVVDVGAMDGSRRIRSLFDAHKLKAYIGIDIYPGMGVDVCTSVENLQSVLMPEIADVVISAVTLEHVEDWRKSLSNMKRICKKGGVVFITVPSRYMYHACPGDYWRYTKENMEAAFSDFEILISREETITDVHSLVYIKARKPDVFSENDTSGIHPRRINPGDKW